MIRLNRMLLAFIMGMFLIAVVSSFTFDNIKNYDTETKTVDIRNSILGVPFLEREQIAELKLNTPQNVKVGLGYQKVAEFENTYYLDDNGGLDLIETYDLNKDFEKIDRQIDYKVKMYKMVEVPDYEEVCVEYLENASLSCSSVEKGSHQENKSYWEDLDYSKLEKGRTYTIGLFTNVKQGDYVEWIPTFYGVKIDEWASWNADLKTGLVAYYPLNESSGNILDNSDNSFDGTNTGCDYEQTGKIGYGVYCDRDTDDNIVFNNVATYINFQSAYTITGWFKVNDDYVSGAENYGAWGFNQQPKMWYRAVSGTWAIDTGAIAGYSLADSADAEWRFIAVRYDGSIVNMSIYNETAYILNITYAEGGAVNDSLNFYLGTYGDTARDYSGVIDEVGIWNRTLNNTEIDLLWNNGLGCTINDDNCLGAGNSPTVTLIAPENHANYTVSNTVNFEYNCTDDLNVDNCTLSIGGAPTDINTSGVNGTYYYSAAFADGYYNWSVTAIDNDSLSTTSSLRYFNVNTSSSYPGVDLEEPADDSLLSSGEIVFNCKVYDDDGIMNVGFLYDGVLNETNSSGINNTVYHFSKNISEGEHNWTCEAWDSDNQSTIASEWNVTIDLTEPLIENIGINQTNVFGWPSSFSVGSSESDVHLEGCWYHTDYNETNVSFTCSSNITLYNLEWGQRTVYIYANDSLGHENGSSESFMITYYTHNITYRDNSTGSLITPSCVFNGSSSGGSEHHYNILNTTSRLVDCTLAGYGTFNHTLTESNKTSYYVNATSTNINFRWDEATDVRVSWIGGAEEYEGVTLVYLDLASIPIGDVHMTFNNETQNFVFYHDNLTSVSRDFHVETIDLDQQIKVVSSSNEIKRAFVEFKKSDNDTLRTTYSEFTDINGIAHIVVNDGTSYEVEVTAEGYEDYNAIMHIPYSNTETIIINLIELGGVEGDYYFTSSCLNVVGSEKNCSWYVKSYRDANITFNYTWNGSFYSVTSEDSEANLTLLVNEDTTPVSVLASVNPTKTYTVNWSGLANRSIQIDFDDEEIKDETNGILILFFAIVLILGIIIAVIINNMPKMKGMGIWGMTVWFVVIAIKFPIIWFIVVPALIYAVFKTFWGSE